MDRIRLPTSCLVVLIGASGAGKTTWADANFAWHQVVSSDRLRAMVGASDADRRAGTDAFDLLDTIVERRLRRGLLTVIDTLGLDPQRRRAYVALAARFDVPAHAVVFATADEVCRERNRRRLHPVPQKVLAGQLRQARTVGGEIGREGFAAVHEPAPVAVVGAAMVDAPELVRRQQEAPLSMRFGLQISDFTWEGGPAEMGGRLAAVAGAAEDAGFSGIWVMDHFRQIPQVGPEWHDMPESYTTLAYLAGVTDRVTLGTLVTGVGYRNPAHLAKIVATLDVLSGGRAVCGIGLGWFDKEATAYGWEQAPVATRYALLEDTLEVLRLIWGPGAPSFEGRVIRVPEGMCYPRPLQEHIPILVGGGGETRTLRLVARHADMCNLLGDEATVQHKVEVLRRHCRAEGRDPSEIEVTHLSRVLIGEDRESIRAELARLAGPDRSLEQTAERLGAGTVEDHIGRMRRLAEAGVQHAIVGLHDVADLAPIRRFAEVIAAFR